MPPFILTRCLWVECVCVVDCGKAAVKFLNIIGWNTWGTLTLTHCIKHIHTNTNRKTNTYRNTQLCTFLLSRFHNCDFFSGNTGHQSHSTHIRHRCQCSPLRSNVFKHKTHISSRAGYTISKKYKCLTNQENGADNWTGAPVMQ